MRLSVLHLMHELDVADMHVLTMITVTNHIKNNNFIHFHRVNQETKTGLDIPKECQKIDVNLIRDDLAIRDLNLGYKVPE